MDLLATVRKEGTRGGTGDFKWTDVQSSTHREHYLGHSLMAPVGRWQKNRDLGWYARSDSKDIDGENPEQKAIRERKEEIRRVKEAEEDALARALGLPVPDRNNANTEALGNRRDVDRALKDTLEKNEDDIERGVGFGTAGNGDTGGQKSQERIEGNAEAQDQETQQALKEYKRRHGHREQNHRIRSRSRDRDREGGYYRSMSRDRDRHRSQHHRRRSRDRATHRQRRSRSRSTSRDRKQYNRSHDRSRSPRQKRRSDRERHRQRD